MMTWMNLNFQNPNSINSFNIIMFHNFMMIMIINISLILMMMMKFNLKNKFNNKNNFNNQKLELTWTLMPIITIFFISMFSINILFINNEMKQNILNLKIYGNQWFWNYEYPTLNKKFNSYLMINNNYNFFMLETDNSFIIPFNYQILISITSMDVIHSWTIPSINIKMDAIPNQLNHMIFMTNKSNIFFGQCSEVCGINHSFMPIKMESVNMKFFIYWLNNNIYNFNY